MPLKARRSIVKNSIEKHLDKAAKAYFADPMLAQVDFGAPKGEPALVGPDSISWRIFKNPISLFIGGVAAVILEFADPRVRSGVWENTSFKTDPVTRLKRTGLAAMVTIYGARSVAEKMIAGVSRRHRAISGITPAGVPYTASDPELLTWVQVTAAFGFIESYNAYVAPVSDDDRNCFYAEGQAAAALYGATGAPATFEAQQLLFASMASHLERTEIIFEFLKIMKETAAFPKPAHLAQPLLIRAAIEIIPDGIRKVLDLDMSFGLRPFERQIAKQLGRRADQMMLQSSPAIQACRRIGLADDFLYQSS